MAAPTNTGKSTAFKRTQVSARERVISFIILALLAGIGTAIFIKGRSFDPSLYSLRSEALKSGNETSAGDALDVSLPGIKPMNNTEFYSTNNLYEKIDGRAPAYLEFNFQQLRCRSFSLTDAPGSFVDVFEFQMDTPINAFGIFALERDLQGKPLDFIADGYSGAMGFFFRQGNYYIQVISSDQKPATLEKARAIAALRAKNLPVDDTGLAARRRLPSTDMVAGSVTYTQDNAFGQDYLKEVFQASYKRDDTKLSFFVMVAAPPTAEHAWTSFQKFCERFGTVTVLPPVNGAHVFAAEVFGTWKVIYERQGELGGVFDAGDDGKARRFVEDYLEGKLK